MWLFCLGCFDDPVAFDRSCNFWGISHTLLITSVAFTHSLSLCKVSFQFDLKTYGCHSSSCKLPLQTAPIMTWRKISHSFSSIHFKHQYLIVSLIWKYSKVKNMKASPLVSFLSFWHMRWRKKALLYCQQWQNWH